MTPRALLVVVVLLSVHGTLSSAPAFAQAGQSPTTQVSAADQLAHLQRNIEAQMRELQERMFRLGEQTRLLEPDDSARLIMAVRRAREQLVLDGVITVLDVVRARRALEFDVTVEQLGFADLVVLSHVDEAAGADVDAVENSLSRYAPGAVRVRASRGETSTPFLDLLAQRAETLHVVAEGSGHSSIEAISLVLDGELDDDRFGDWIESALGDVEARILRLKGILAMEGLGVRVILQGVSESVQVLMGAPWGDAPRTSRLVILGLGLDAAALEAGFKRCAAGS